MVPLHRGTLGVKEQENPQRGTFVFFVLFCCSLFRVQGGGSGGMSSPTNLQFYKEENQQMLLNLFHNKS